eukprot:m.276320 g.276320  ORF g.276320 m.276320 type:complete len:181 (+) comp22865_c2_seq1:1649-2191(+)
MYVCMMFVCGRGERRIAWEQQGERAYFLVRLHKTADKWGGCFTLFLREEKWEEEQEQEEEEEDPEIVALRKQIEALQKQQAALEDEDEEEEANVPSELMDSANSSTVAEPIKASAPAPAPAPAPAKAAPPDAEFNPFAAPPAAKPAPKAEANPFAENPFGAPPPKAAAKKSEPASFNPFA